MKTIGNNLNGVRITGYVARPKHFRGDRKGIISVVNNRPVRCPLTLKALDNVFNDLIPRGRYPLAAVFVTVDASEVDVNVHPTKKEIKYTKGNDIYLSIHRSLKEAIGTAFNTTSHSPDDAFDSPGTSERFASLTIAEPANKFDYSATHQLDLADRLSYVPPSSRAASQTIMAPMSSQAPATLPPDWRLIGYLHNTYFLLETKDGLEIVEQHIAHERVLYERLLASQHSQHAGSQPVQKLALPLPLDLNSEQLAWSEENIELLRSLGFDFTFADSQAACSQVPVTLSEANRSQTIQAIVESLRIDDAITDGNLDPRLEATKSIACQSAIKNGMQLSQSDIIDLLGAWDKTPRNDTCPHGRPIRLKLSMEKLFQIFHP